jgi:chemotaxis protein MotB
MRTAPLLLLLLASGCLVPKKRFDAAETELAAARAEIARRDDQLAKANEQVDTLTEALAKAEDEVALLRSRIEAAKVEFKARVDALAAEKAELLKTRSALKASVDEMTRALADLEARKAAAEARVVEFKALLEKFGKLIDAGKLRVKIVDGRMVLELPTDILVASGKADLSPDGRDALLEVAAVLASFPGRDYQVEGHTDDVPIKTERFPSNWQLASARAQIVTDTLIAGGVRPERLSAASFSEYRPVGDNQTPEGRASNRRIEIVMIPDLSLLPGYEELSKAAAE